MSGHHEDQDHPALIPADAEFATVLLHGCRFRAHRRAAYPYDILTEGGGGKHVATVHGDAGDSTDENAACLAASAEMLTTLVDLVTAHCQGYDLPWEKARTAIQAGFGAPKVRDRFISRCVENVGTRSLPAGTTWEVTRLSFCPSRRVMVRLAAIDDESVELEYSLDMLRVGFQPVEA